MLTKGGKVHIYISNYQITTIATLISLSDQKCMAMADYTILLKNGKNSAIAMIFLRDFPVSYKTLDLILSIIYGEFPNYL